MITKEAKQEIVAKYGKNAQDTGSPRVQVALLTYRINYLTEHLKGNKNDFHSRRGMYKLIGQRMGLLNYIKKNDIEEYRSLIKELGIRK